MALVECICFMYNYCHIFKCMTTCMTIKMALYWFFKRLAMDIRLMWLFVCKCTGSTFSIYQWLCFSILSLLHLYIYTHVCVFVCCSTDSPSSEAGDLPAFTNGFGGHTQKLIRLAFSLSLSENPSRVLYIYTQYLFWVIQRIYIQYNLYLVKVECVYSIYTLRIFTCTCDILIHFINTSFSYTSY